VVVEDSAGIAARLDAAMEAAVGAYRDPWQERDVTPGQFRTALPLLDLPRVPVRESLAAAPTQSPR
jgi:nitrite reductase (NADH) large subunit